MAGSNLQYPTQTAARRKVLNSIMRRVGLGGTRKIAFADAAPTPNSSDDEPNEVGDIVYNRSGPSVWICTSHSGPTSHTWTRIDSQ